MLTGYYEAPLVLLSVLVAILASYTALTLAARVRRSHAAATRWVAGGAFAMGTGIWGMHFIGMLAFRLPIPLGYDLGITLLSWILPIGVSAVALRQLGQAELSPRQLGQSGLLLGIGINAMHYVGMAAMRMDPAIVYDPWLIGASVVIAIAASTTALWIGFRLRASTSPHLRLYRGAAAVVMGFAIVGMHYTGMAAASFPAASVCRAAAGQFSLAQLAALVVLATVSILTVTLLTSVYEARLEARAAVLALSQQTASERQRLLEREHALRLEAERLSALKDEFLATLSHELRTPLSAMLGWAHVLRSRHDEAIVAKAVDAIERNARSQARLIDDLLDMSRMASGRVRIEPERVRLATIVDAALEVVRPSALAKQIELSFDHDPRCGPVWADPGRLQQVMGNLLGNAIKFTPAQGAVSVHLSQHGEEVVVRVQDTGVGISADFLPHVFERFRQADGSTTRRHGGLGLGLAISRQLVELHGGALEASSDGLGKGALLTLRLPLAPDDAHAGAPSPESPADPAGAPPPAAMDDLAGLRLLVVDDEADARGWLLQLLTGRGAQVTTAGSAAAALDLMAQHLPDVVLCDIGMPDVDGFQLIRLLRNHADARVAALKAVALTAFARPEDESRALREGFDAFLRKPIEPSTLVERIARLR